MNERTIILFLQIIRGNGCVDELLNRGFEYSQIGGFFVQCKAEGLLVESKGKTTLSDKGLLKLNELNKKYGRLNTEQWISPDDTSIVKRLKKGEIYVPEGKKLNLR